VYGTALFAAPVEDHVRGKIVPITPETIPAREEGAAQRSVMLCTVSRDAACSTLQLFAAHPKPT
jgi:hypothetical protein